MSRVHRGGNVNTFYDRLSASLAGIGSSESTEPFIVPQQMHDRVVHLMEHLGGTADGVVQLMRVETLEEQAVRLVRSRQIKSDQHPSGVTRAVECITSGWPYIC
jgi:hypothetical protein